MKKAILFTAALFLGMQTSKACGWYDPDYEYFGIFTQEIIHNKQYEPFLLTYSNNFYGDSSAITPDENIEVWKVYFKDALTYEETDALVKIIDIKHLNNLKKGNLSHDLFKKMGKDFYTKFSEGIDYLIQAKYMEPYMRFSEETYYANNDYNTPIIRKSASAMNYPKTVAALNSLYKAAKNPEIKLRYAYQLVRFQHYTRNYKQAISSFNELVTPLKRDTPIYWYALDQKAGAQRGLNLNNEANGNFLQVLRHRRNKKESGYKSMFLAEDKDFESILKRAKTAEEKNMAYFLLAYDGFSNPVSLMEKMYANNANSDILKVLTARSINGLERSYLPIYMNCDENCDKTDKRLPLFSASFNYNSSEEDTEAKNHAKNLEQFIEKVRSKSDDEFWQISSAYVKFLNKDYTGSQSILNQIKTSDVDYLAEIEKMKMLNEIVAQPKITAEFEEKMVQKYGNFFSNEKVRGKYDWETQPTTKEFIFDILANRYLLQGEDGKSFLMNNKLSDLQYNPNSFLVKSVHDFYKKTNKTSFEKLIAKNMDSVGDTESFFNVIYGDKAMRNADFASAKSFYEKAKKFTGIPRLSYDWDEKTGKSITSPIRYDANEYNGFNNISSLIFGHNVWESFGSAADESMKAENTSQFSFIKTNMNKLELAETLIQLQKIGSGKDEKATKANQLIGNVLYNTSILGYYRETFVMDVNNQNGPKFHFWNTENTPFHYYYKNFSYSSFVDPDNFDLAIQFYSKALQNAKDKEQKARILFQMASAEQGKYYQWETSQSFNTDYGDKDYDAKRKEYLKNIDKTKNEKYRTAFADLKKNYQETKTYQDLQSSCLYFGYYSRK